MALQRAGRGTGRESDPSPADPVPLTRAVKTSWRQYFCNVFFYTRWAAGTPSHACPFRRRVCASLYHSPSHDGTHTHKQTQTHRATTAPAAGRGNISSEWDQCFGTVARRPRPREAPTPERASPRTRNREGGGSAGRGRDGVNTFPLCLSRGGPVPCTDCRWAAACSLRFWPAADGSPRQAGAACTIIVEYILLRSWCVRVSWLVCVRCSRGPRAAAARPGCPRCTHIRRPPCAPVPPPPPCAPVPPPPPRRLV